MRLFLEIILYFFIYSFLGWVSECIYCSIGHKKIINRGFLNGPICPIYGFGALIIIFFLKGYENKILKLFIYGIIVTSILEYVTGYLLETIFNTTWWDYSRKKFNIKGRICLKNSLLFGTMSVILMKIIHKCISSFTLSMPTLFLIFLAINNILLFCIDLSFTIASMNNLKYKLKSLEELTIELRHININTEKINEDNLKGLLENLKNKGEIKTEKIEEIIGKLHIIKNKSINQRRIINAFPNMKHRYSQERFINFKQIIKSKRK
ncbi:putative ABC transporter permease [Romboutsia lituseburensis]|uniref:putative ABC transporter permease n=1 Tax=Romboutsia lituseburensis TaxID=1537 RepID=UPI00215A8218|nr:putative ABC transporter permease [Romboutsia lituseburensis]MCR8743811.1 putative ABC transporter permease [Romboutsia lituseburensis]